MSPLVLISALLAQVDGGVALTEPERKEVEEAVSAARELIRSKETKNFKLAAARLERCTAKAPRAADCWGLLATAYVKLGALEKAKPAFERYLELSEPVELPPSPYERRFPWVDYPLVPK